MTEKLKTFHLRVRYLDTLRHGQFITAPTKEDAIKLFLEEYVYISSEKEEL